MTTIIYAHPYDGSFNHAVLQEITKSLEKAGQSYTVIDLYADGFNPAIEAPDLRLYSRGETTDPLVEKYLKTLLSTDRLIFIFPVWWGMMPAIVKGFFDKVLLVGSAYRYSEEGALIPDKINIERTLMLTTSQSPADRFKPFFAEYLKETICDAVGFHNLEWIDCEQTAHGPAKNREDFLRIASEKTIS